MKNQIAKQLSVVIVAAIVFMVGITFVSADEDAATQDSLADGQEMQAWVAPNDVSNSHAFNSKENQSLFLVIVSDPNAEAPSIFIENTTKNETVASLRLMVTGMCLRIAPGAEQYLLTVTQSHAGMAQLYDVMIIPASSDQLDCPENIVSKLTNKILSATANMSQDEMALAALNNQFVSDVPAIDNPPVVLPPVVTSVPPVVTAVPPVIVIDVDVNLGECLAIAGDLNVNVRNTTSLTAGIVAQIHANTAIPVIGSIEGNAWLLVNHNGVLGFVSSAAVAVGGICSEIPVILVDGSTVIDLGMIVDLGLYVNVVADLSGIVADLDLNIGDTGLTVDANVGSDGITVGVDAGLGDGGLNVDVDASVGDDGINVGVDLGDGGLDVGIGEGGINIGGSTGNTGSTGNNGGININVGGSNGININVGGSNGGGLNLGG